jgi:aspartyl-tRNA(Asn)/glutamyl-tRNA(Gln) amidotransferase subunit A
MNRIGEYDPRIGKRINAAKELSAADYVDLLRLRQSYIAEVAAVLACFDAFLMPTTPCIAPTIQEVDASDEDYFRWNMRILRNVGVVNFLDGCAVSLPCHAPGTAPVGLSVCGPALSDRHILAVARAVEGVLAGRA